jgi:hypothetical protein
VSVRSPSAVAISISGMLNSEEKPGPKKASDISSVRVSLEPTEPLTETESVFVLVAPAHGAATWPKRSWPAAFTLIVAEPPVVIVAVTALVVGL